LEMASTLEDDGWRDLPAYLRKLVA
jgi:hypothetical protein